MAANRLLILDDDPRVLKLLVAAGERSRYEVTPVENISTFREALETTEPSLIVVDIQTQGGLGSDLLLYLQRRGCGVPIILVGGADSHALGAVRQAQTLSGLTILGTLVKPFPVEALRALLETRREPDLDEWAGEIRAAIEARQLGVQFLPIVEVTGGRWSASRHWPAGSTLGAA